MTEPERDKTFEAFMGGPSTGNDLADIIRRITPEDGAVNGVMRANWEDICLKAAAHMREILPGIRERHRHRFLDEGRTWVEESVMEAALKEALVFRKQLLSNNGDKNDG